MWDEPANNGGATATHYVVEWDMDESFFNIDTSGYQREVKVASPTDPYHHNEYFKPASAHLPRYFRVRAQKDRGIRVCHGISVSSPLSAKPMLLSPGQPQNVRATPTSGAGILVSWDEPDADLSEYGGDGGSAIKKYVIEWDTSPHFDTPASHVELRMPAGLSQLMWFRTSAVVKRENLNSSHPK